MARQDRTAAGSGVAQALVYTRVSGREQEKEGLSLPAQLADCRRYVAQSGWVIAGEYQDVLKGTRDDRPRYQALLTEARRLRTDGKPVAIVCKWLHRLGRRVLESVRCREEFKALGVPIHSVLEGGEVNDFLANVMAAAAQFEVEQLGERVGESIEYAIENGWHPLGNPAWGYRWRPATPEERAMGAPQSVMAVDPAEAPCAQEVFRRVAAGQSIRRVSEWTSGLPEAARGGRAVTYATLRQMLRNRAYVAEYVETEPVPVYAEVNGRQERKGTKWVPLLRDGEPVVHQGRWPALVDRETWGCVQERIAGHRKMAHQASGRYLLSGVIWCPACAAGGRDSRMRARADKRRPSGSYFCTAQLSGARGAWCKASVSAALVEAEVRREIGGLLAALDASPQMAPRWRAALKRAWDELRAPKYAGDVLKEVRRLELEKARAKKRLTDAALKLVDGDLDRAGYDGLRQRVERDLATAEAGLVRARAAQPASPDLPELEVVLAHLSIWPPAIEQADVPAQREVLAFLIERVVPKRITRGTYDVAIRPTPVGEGLRRLAEALASETPAATG